MEEKQKKNCAVKNCFKNILPRIKKYPFYTISAVLGLLLVLDVVLLCQVNSARRLNNQKKVDYIYVYNVNQLVQNLAVIAEVKQDYESKISQLNAKVNDARKKLDDMKDKKAKEEFATVYLSSLTLQRDQLAEQYQQQIRAIDAKINQALVDVANENGLPYVFDSKSVIVTTPYVVDVTGAVLKKLQ